MSRRGRRRAIGALIVAIAPLVAGCGSEMAGSEPATPQPETTAVETASTAVAGTDAGTEEFIDRFDSGIAALRTARVTGETVAADGSITSEGVVDYTGSTPAQAQTVTLSDGTSTEVIFLDGLAYLRGSTDELWYVTDAANIEGANSDPQAQMSAFAAAIVAAERIGTEEVLTVTTDVYDVTLDPAQLAAPSGSDSWEMGLQAWLDSDDFPVQMVVSMGDGAQTMTTTMTMTEINEPVTIEAPPADQVTDQMPSSGG